MKDIIYNLIKDNAVSLLAVTTGSMTALAGYFTVGKYKNRKERWKIGMDTNKQFRGQLLNVNTELSKVFDLHIEASKKHHAARLEIEKLKAELSFIKSELTAIRTKCVNSCNTPITPESNKSN